jgi:hypothetical protein
MIELIKKCSYMWIKGAKHSDIVLVLKNQKVPEDKIRKILRLLNELRESPATASKCLADNFDLEIDEAKHIMDPILIAQNAQFIKDSKRNIGYGSLWVVLGIIATIYLPLDILYYALMGYGVVRIVKGIIQFGNS